MECPKCGYVRQAHEAAPDYECPKCGVIYAKFTEAERQRAAQAARWRYTQRGRVCASCGDKRLIPVGTPKGRALLAEVAQSMQVRDH